MVYWTHRYDLLAKAIAFVLLVAGVLVVIEGPLKEFDGGPVVFFAVAAPIAGLIWLLLWRPILAPGASWMYLWRSLGLKLSWADARALSPLFSLDWSNLTWQPCLDLRDLPPDQRQPLLRARLDALLATRTVDYFERTRAAHPLTRRLSPASHKVMAIVNFIAAPLLLIGLLSQQGPFERVVAWTSFSDGSWYPILSFFVVYLPFAALSFLLALGFDKLSGYSAARG